MANITYHKVGTTYRDYFDYAVTGLSDSDFTVEIAKNGANQADAGTTITNISSGRRYALEVDAASGFPSATGTYQVIIYRTSIPNDRWESIVVVNTLGLPTGTTGLASFTSTTADGRVTDGSSALEDATVYIARPSGALLAATTTDSNGNWGPVHFDADGTYSVTVQLGGYTIGTASIVVSGSTATGPGDDIEITATAAAGTLLASTLWAYARRMFHSRTGDKADAEVQGAVNDALAMVAGARDWPWLYTTGRVNFKAAYTTGTVTVTEGSAVVTLADGTFPTWAASGDIYIAGQWQSIAARDGGTQLTLDNAWASADTDGSGLTYVLAQYQYDLPSDCRTVVNVVVQNGWLWGPAPCSRWLIDLARMTPNASSGAPSSFMYAIEKNRMAVWPYPTADLMVNVLYIKKPAALTSASQTADWDDNQAEVLYRAIDYQVSIRGECVAGPTAELFERYKEALARAIPNDRTTRPRTVGFSGGGGMVPQNLGGTVR